MKSPWLILGVLMTCISTTCAESHMTCEEPEKDPEVYLFGYGHGSKPYEYINDDGELAGFGYDITRAVCKVMNKNCQHVVNYQYSLGWDTAAGKSTALNNRWQDAWVSWLPTKKRLSAYSFFGEYANAPPTYMFVRKDSDDNTMDKIKSNVKKFGFRANFYQDDDCLGRNLGMSLEGMAHFYETNEAIEAALASGEVDVILRSVNGIINPDAVQRIGDDPVYCAEGGLSVMTRKDDLHKFAWYDQGLQKIRENGDYDWICRINSKEQPTYCFGD